MRVQGLSRQLATRGFVAIGCCCTLVACDALAPRPADKIRSELGNYDVRRLGAAPVPGVVTARSVNDGGVVVGYVATASGDRPFRWENGQYTMLEIGGASSGRATDVNAGGDIVGVASGPVIWPVGQMVPSPILATGVPASARDLLINKFGGISGSSNSGGFYLTPPPRTMVAIRETFIPSGMSDSGDVAGNCGYNWSVCVFPPLPGNAPPGYVQVWLDLNRGPILMNSAGDSFIQGVTGHGNYRMHRSLRSRTGEIQDVTVADSASMSGFWTAMNRHRWLAGLFDNKVIVTNAGIDGFVELDAVLLESVGPSAAWHVQSVIRLSDSGMMLVTAQSAMGPSESVLLVPRR